MENRSIAMVQELAQAREGRHNLSRQRELPVIGGAFRNQSDKIEKTELVVMMKATIIDGSANTVHSTDKDMYRTFSQDRRPFDF